MEKNRTLFVGNTPIQQLSNIEKHFNLKCHLFAKLEKENPAGSVKDRAVMEILKDYQEKGVIHPGSTIIEATSGNTGISLSAFGKELGYHIIIVMPASMSLQRRELIKSYGAELEIIDGNIQQCKDRAVELNQQIPNSIIFGQFEHPANVLAHFRHTAPEIQIQVPDVTYVIAGFGTGGTITGIGRYFKANNKTVKVVGVEPKQSPLVTEGYANKHKIQGIGANFIPPILDQKMVDDFIAVDDEEAIQMAKLIYELEGLFVGISSGAALLGAINYIKKYNLEGEKIVIIFPDGGERYSWN
ncbi:MAG: cysteine synthase family protein [Bacilli bacterium]|nr:cysteine synthase family protein [Bacilli bacterium]